MVKQVKENDVNTSSSKSSNNSRAIQIFLLFLFEFAFVFSNVSTNSAVTVKCGNVFVALLPWPN